MKRFVSVCMILAILLTAVIGAPVTAGTISAKASSVESSSKPAVVEFSSDVTYSNNYDMTVSIFGRDTCYNTKKTLHNIVDYGVDQQKNIRVLFIDCDQNTKAVIEQMADEYRDSNIIFCYDTSTNANNTMWSFARTANFGNSVTFPLIVFRKKDGTIFKITQSLLDADYLHQLANGDLSGEEMINLKIAGKENYDNAFQVLDQLNSLRNSVGLKPLTMDKDLLSAAMKRAAELSIYYSHTRPNGERCFTVLNGLTGSHGENIAVGYRTSDDVMMGWTNSSGHYANMTDSDFSSVGIGCFVSSSGYLCWVQLFSSTSANSIHKSGEVTVEHSIDARMRNLNLDFSTEHEPHDLKKNDYTKINVFNYNKGWSYLKQNISGSLFHYSSSHSDVMTIADNGYCTIKGSGKTTITVSFKSTDVINMIGEVTVGHVFTDNADVYCDVCGEKAYPGGNILYKENGKYYHLVNREKVKDTTLVKHTNGKWYYVEKGVVDATQNGLFKYNGKYYHIVNGKVVSDTTLVKHTDGNWYYVNNGAVDFTKNGKVYYSGKYYTVKNGVVDFTQGGLFKSNGKYYYYENGKMVLATKLVKHIDGKWYYVNKGVVDFTKTGLVKHTDGNYYHIKSGVKTNSTLLFKHTDGKWYYVQGGKVTFTKTGLVKHTNGKYYYVQSGKINFTKTGLVKHTDGNYYHVKGGVKTNSTLLFKHTDGKWYYVQGGKVTFTKTGLVKHTNGKYYYVQSGKINFTKTGLVKHTDGNYYHVKNGIKTNATLLFKHTDGKWYYVQGGKVTFTKTGLVKHTNGKWYYVKKGVIDFTKNGNVYHNGKYYTVKKGVVV